MVRALRSGEVDAILSSDLRKVKDEKILDVVNASYFYLMTRKDEDWLLNEINYAIEQINQEYGDWGNNLFYKYYGPEQPVGLAFTKREKEYMDEVRAGKKKITVTARPDRAPYSYASDGKLVGILPDYFAKLMAMVDLPYEVVVPKDAAGYYNMVKSNAVDVVIDHIAPTSTQASVKSLERNDAALRGFATDSYMRSGVARLTRSDRAGPLVRIALVDAVDEIPLSREPGGRARFQEYPTRHDAMEAVRDE